MFFYRAPKRPFNGYLPPMTQAVTREIINAGPNGIDLEELSAKVHGPGRLHTTRVYLSWDLPNNGLQAVRLNNGNISIVPTEHYGLLDLI